MTRITLYFNILDGVQVNLYRFKIQRRFTIIFAIVTKKKMHKLIKPVTAFVTITSNSVAITANCRGIEQRTKQLRKNMF